MTGATESTVVVLTALDVESDAMRRLLHGRRDDPHPSGTIFEVGRRPGRSGQVVLVGTGPGNPGAAVLAERAINRYSPAAALFVGIAGAVHDDLELGDVVIATRVYAYHGGAESAAGFRARPQAWEAPHALLEVARALHRSGRLSRLDARRGHTPAIHFRPIAAGEVVLNSPYTPLAQQLRDHYHDAAAVEMESAGTAKAAHLNRGLPFLTVRGISDTVSLDKGFTDRNGCRRVAADAAAAVAAELIDAILIGAIPDPGPEIVDLRLGGAAALGRPTGVLTDIRRPLGLEPLPTAPVLTWRRSLPGDGRHSLERAALELHLVPTGAGGRLEMRDLRQLPDQLIARGRGVLFSASEGLTADSDQQFAWARGIGYDRGPRGLAVSRGGQRSAWWPLPHDGLGSVLDVDELPGQLLTLLGLLADLPIPAPARTAPAVAIAPVTSVSEDKIARMPRRSASMGWIRGDEVTVPPEDALDFTAVRDRAEDVAEELALRLVAAFRAAR